MANSEKEEIRANLRKIKAAPPGGSVAEQRALLENLVGQFPLPENIEVSKIQVDSVPGEWVSANNAIPNRAILYLHGGAYLRGSLNTHRELAARISLAAGVRVLVIDYRLAPESLFPAPVEDALTAYRWLLRNNFTSECIVFAGDSAGGGLSVATMLALGDAGEALPAGAVLLSPWIDLAGTGDSMTTRDELDPWMSGSRLKLAAQVYLGDADFHNPLASPLYGDLHGLPPLFIQVGSDEILFDDSIRLAERAKAAGVTVTLEEWPEMWHIFQAFATVLPERQQAIDHIGQFVRERLDL